VTWYFDLPFNNIIDFNTCQTFAGEMCGHHTMLYFFQEGVH
jgi:hypothetical protein